MIGIIAIQRQKKHFSAIFKTAKLTHKSTRGIVSISKCDEAYFWALSQTHNQNHTKKALCTSASQATALLLLQVHCPIRKLSLEVVPTTSATFLPTMNFRPNVFSMHGEPSRHLLNSCFPLVAINLDLWPLRLKYAKIVTFGVSSEENV